MICLDLGNEGLIKVDLADVGDVAACYGTVGELGCVEVDHDCLGGGSWHR